MTHPIDWPTVGPRLLEALQEMESAAHIVMAVRGWSDAWENTGIPERARSAIAAAKGETT